MKSLARDIIERASAFARRLRADCSGLALIEFGFAAPIVLAMGTLGLETTNLVLAHMRISQIALNLADNVSRVGEESALSLKQLREVDINNSFEAARLQSGGFDVTTHGRIILSSLENDTANGNWIRWQRCLGLLPVSSSYGSAGDGAGSATFNGMGPTGSKITASSGTAVMFVEIIYDYQPLFAARLLGTQRLNYTAAFVVRDQRDLTQVYNNAPAVTASTCNLFTT